MAIDHLPLSGVQSEKAVGVFQGPVCMVESVPFVIAVFFVPIVEIEVMQESTPHQGTLISPQVKAPVEPKAHPGYIGTVSIGCDTAMLNILPHLPGLGGIGDSHQKTI